MPRSEDEVCVKFSRNMKCPCESGKKFKKCCGDFPEGSPLVSAFPVAEFVLFRQEPEEAFFREGPLSSFLGTLRAHFLDCASLHGELYGKFPSRMFVEVAVRFDSGIGLPRGFADLGGKPGSNS